jgi:hypothetical protein
VVHGDQRGKIRLIFMYMAHPCQGQNPCEIAVFN